MVNTPNPENHPANQVPKPEASLNGGALSADEHSSSGLLNQFDTLIAHLSGVDESHPQLAELRDIRSQLERVLSGGDTHSISQAFAEILENFATQKGIKIDTSPEKLKESLEACLHANSEQLQELQGLRSEFILSLNLPTDATDEDIVQKISSFTQNTQLIKKLQDKFSLKIGKGDEDILEKVDNIADILQALSKIEGIGNVQWMIEHPDILFKKLEDPKFAVQLQKVAELQKRQARDEARRNWWIAGRVLGSIPKWGGRAIKYPLMAIVLLSALVGISAVAAFIRDPEALIRWLKDLAGSQVEQARFQNNVMPELNRVLFGPDGPRTLEELPGWMERFGNDPDKIREQLVKFSRGRVPDFTERTREIDIHNAEEAVEKLITDFESAMARESEAVRTWRFENEIRIPLGEIQTRIAQENKEAAGHVEIAMRQVRDHEVRAINNAIAAMGREFESSVRMLTVVQQIDRRTLREQLEQGRPSGDPTIVPSSAETILQARNTSSALLFAFRDAFSDMNTTYEEGQSHSRTHNPWLTEVVDAVDNQSKPAWQVLRRIWQRALENNFDIVLKSRGEEGTELQRNMTEIFRTYEALQTPPSHGGSKGPAPRGGSNNKQSFEKGPNTAPQKTPPPPPRRGGSGHRR